MADNTSTTALPATSNPKIAVIDEMFYHFVRSEQYVSMTEEARNAFVDTVEEIILQFA